MTDSIHVLFNMKGPSWRLREHQALITAATDPASPDEVVWGTRAVAAAIGTPLEGRARVNLGSSLTNEPGRRDEGRAMLAEVVESHLCDSAPTTSPFF